MSLANLTAEWTPGAAGVWTLVAMLTVYLLREWRETRKLSSEDRQARREGYAKQVESLMVENRQLRDELFTSNERAETARRLCHQENDQLRDQVIALNNRLAAVLRKVADIAIRASHGEMDAQLAGSILQLSNEVNSEVRG